MDKVLIEFQNEGEDPIFVETRVNSLDAQFITAGEPLVKASKAFNIAMRPVLAMAKGMMTEIEALPVRPDTIELEFGIKVSGAVEAWVISASGEGNINLKMSWNTPKAG